MSITIGSSVVAVRSKLYDHNGVGVVEHIFTPKKAKSELAIVKYHGLPGEPPVVFRNRWVKDLNLA